MYTSRKVVPRMRATLKSLYTRHGALTDAQAAELLDWNETKVRLTRLTLRYALMDTRMNPFTNREDNYYGV